MSLRAARALLTALGVSAIAALYLAGLGAALGNSDEAIYAESVRAMHRSGDWFTVTYAGHELLQRPPWSVTLYAAVAAVVPGERGLRLLPALLTLGAALLAGAIVWRRARRLDAGFVAACLAAAAPSMFVYGRVCMSDPPFVVAVVAALCATLAALDDPRWLPHVGAGLGAAVAFKSLAAAVPAAALLPWIALALARHRRAPGFGRRVALAAALFLALAAPFYLIGLFRHGGRFLALHFGYNLADRARGLPGIGVGGPAAYLTHLWRADGPVVAILLLFGPLAAAGLALRRRDARLGAAASAALGTLLLLSALGTRLPHYLLPFYPLAAVATGLALAAALAPLPPARPAYRLVLPALGLVLVLHGAGRPAFDESTIPATDTRTIGLLARTTLPPDAPLYTLDFYAPAIGWYADRPWKLLTTYDRMAEIVGGVDTFRDADVVHRVPPWPRGRLFLVAPKEALARAPEAAGAPVVASAGDLLLLELRLR